MPDTAFSASRNTLLPLPRARPPRPEGWNQALVEPPPLLSLSPGRRYSQLESNPDISPLTTPTTTASRCGSWSTEGERSAPRGRLDQRRCGQRSLDGRGTSGSVSSGSRLTPPGQRTPRLSLASPPPLRSLTGGAIPPSGRRAAAGGGPEDAPLNSGAVPPPSEAAACDEGNHSGSRGARGGEGERPSNTAVQQCAGTQGEGGGGKRQDCGDDRKEGNEDTNGSRQDKGNGEHSERKSGDGAGGGGPGGGAGGGDDGDGAGNAGEEGTRDDVGDDEEADEDDDREEEVEEGGADVEVDTFLRLSEVDFCEGSDVFEGGGTSAVLSASSEALDSSIGGLSSCGGGENSHALSRHLSDFFRSPLSLDLAPQQRPASLLSLSEVQTGARLFGSMKSTCSDDKGAFSISESGNFSDSRNALGVVCGAIGTSEAATSVDGPRSSTPPAAGGATSPPCTVFMEEVAAHHLASPATSPPLQTDEARDAPIAESDESPVTTKRPGEGVAAEVRADLALVPNNRAGTRMEAFKAENIHEAAVEEERKQSDVGGGGGGGGESEEEWLADDVGSPGDVTNEATGSCTAVSTASQDAEAVKANQAAATPVSHWAGLNEDGSWRTERARQAAGKAGEVEAERRRLAKISADESWRSDAGGIDGADCRGRRDVRRESISFVRVQSGNVR